MPPIPSVRINMCDDAKQLSFAPNVGYNLLLFPDLAPARKCVYGDRLAWLPSV